MFSELYSLMKKYEKSASTYDMKLIDVVKKFFEEESIPYSFDFSAWPNDEGAACAFSFVIDGKPRLFMFDVEG